MKINVHAGHNPSGMVACGAVGILDESKENRIVKDALIDFLKMGGCEVYDCTENEGKSQSDVLKKIVAKCNSHKVDLDVSIHFNAGGGHGSEALIYRANSDAYPYAERICERLAELGFRNRGVKVNPSLAVLKNTNAPAVLVECCFVDSQEDADIYRKCPEAIAEAIAGGILNERFAHAYDEAPKKEEINFYPKFTGNSPSIVDSLKAVGEKDTSLVHRRAIAKANDIEYMSTYDMNVQLLRKLKNGELKKA